MSDDVVHARLCEHGFIYFVVASPLIPHQVDILVESGSPLRVDSANSHDGFWNISVDVEDWSVDDPPNIRAVGTGPAVSRIRCESNLIIGHNMNSAPEK